jgi:hypothetical protein
MMNKRFEELDEQTTAICIKLTENGQGYNRQQIFAELIVRECAKVVDLWSDEVPCSEGYDKFTVGKLKQHFGVE